MTDFAMTEETEDFLEHFGVKGMKWGKHTAATSSTGMTNRELNKASRANDKATAKSEAAEATAKNKADIIGARERVYGGENKAKAKAAKEQYKKDKMEIGSREARKILNAKRQPLLEDAYKSQEYLNGKELFKDLAITALPTPISGAVAVAVRQRSLQKQYGGGKS